MVEIAENQLGKFYISDQDFTNEKNLVFRASMEKETVGFSIVRILSKEEFSAAFQKIDNSDRKFIGHATIIGIIKSIAVAKSYQQRGIGDAIMKQSIDELKSAGVNIVVMIGWKSKLGTNIESLALLNGFRKACEIQNYWSEDSDLKNYDCPVCGAPPCTCSAAIYSLHIEP